MTNVEPEDLNYHHYETARYERDIARTIPGHAAMHEIIERVVREDFASRQGIHVLELGVGTGITAQRVLNKINCARYTAIDFSDTMLEGAKRRLAGYSQVEYIEGDYAQVKLPQDNDLAISVVSIHHQKTDADKMRLFARIYRALNENGAFIFGDLVTYKDPHEAAVNEALHFHHLVKHAHDEEALRDWAHHHRFKNSLAPLEDQIDWLKDVGFRQVDVMYQHFNTALIYAKK